MMVPGRPFMRKLMVTFVFFAMTSMPGIASAKPGNTGQVYRGPIKYPDFNGREHAYRSFRTRITDEMRTGPNFAGHYSIVQIGCGAGCRFVVLADLATGRLYQFPYGGEENYALWLTFDVKTRSVGAQWIASDTCVKDMLVWTGAMFRSQGKRIIGGEDACAPGKTP